MGGFRRHHRAGSGHQDPNSNEIHESKERPAGRGTGVAPGRVYGNGKLKFFFFSESRTKHMKSWCWGGHTQSLWFSIKVDPSSKFRTHLRSCCKLQAASWNEKRTKPEVSMVFLGLLKLRKTACGISSFPPKKRVGKTRLYPMLFEDSISLPTLGFRQFLASPPSSWYLLSV